MGTTTDLLLLARTVHFSACLLLFGWPAFGLVAGAWTTHPALADDWRRSLRRSHWILFPAILLSGFTWFVLVAMNMSGESLQAAVLKTVWQQTQFGIIWQWRTLFWLAAAICAVFVHINGTRRRKLWLWLQLCLAGCLLGSLAWAGHGRESSVWHLLADALHLLVAGIWPTGLLPLFLLLRQLRQGSMSDQSALMVPLIRRFSVTSLASVALLSATGLVNAWFLVGSLPNLFAQNYGRWLLLKIILFVAAVAIGAVNLLRLKPRLRDAETCPSAATQIRHNVLIEIVLATAIVIVVAILGILPPAIEP